MCIRDSGKVIRGLILALPIFGMSFTAMFARFFGKQLGPRLVSYTHLGSKGSSMSGNPVDMAEEDVQELLYALI